jgi:hypothetical protein
MKRGQRFLSFGVISAVLSAIGCGSSAIPIPAGATSTTGSGSGTITSSGAGDQSYVPTFGLSASTIYVVENGSTTGTGSVLELPASGQGSVTPTATLSAPPNTSFSTAAVDQSGNIYVAGYINSPNLSYEVLVYPAGATGSATPARTLTNIPGYVWSLAVDTAGQIYAQTQNEISVFAAGATGNAPPVRQIAGSATQLVGATSIAVDSAQNLYVANDVNILIFSSTATGNAAPARMITEATPGFFQPVGIAVDKFGDILVTSYFAPGLGLTSAIYEYASGASGDVAPISTLNVTSLTADSGMAVDGAGSLYTVVVDSSGQLAVDVFSAGESGTSAPVRTITSTVWNSAALQQIAVY